MRATIEEVRRAADEPERGTVALDSFRLNQRSALSISPLSWSGSADATPYR